MAAQRSNEPPVGRRRVARNLSTTDTQPPIPSEMVTVADLKPHPRNYRKHPPEQIEHIKASLRENNVYRNVVVADDLTLLAGHGVWQAAVDLGIAMLEAKRLPFGPDDPRALKVLAGDNETSRMAVDDDTLLAGLLTEARDNSIEGLLGTGHTDDSLMALLERIAPLTPPEEFPSFHPDHVHVDYTCPSCGFSWSGTSGVSSSTAEA